jgi:cell wall-associated NlpC family hydrolase
MIMPMNWAGLFLSGSVARLPPRDVPAPPVRPSRRRRHRRFSFSTRAGAVRADQDFGRARGCVPGVGEPASVASKQDEARQVEEQINRLNGELGRAGRASQRCEPQPGDLVFFDGLGHEGIYIGGGQFVHAPHTGDVVKVSSLGEGWYTSAYVGARRIT